MFPKPAPKTIESIMVAQPERWHNFLDLNRWDSGWYEEIVKNGYTTKTGFEAGKGTGIPFSIMWYPGYPLIAKPIYHMTGWKPVFIFSLLSAGFTLLFWVLLWRPVMEAKFGRKTLAAASAMIICWPGSFYWFAGMTEPLISLLIVLLIFLWVKEKFNLSVLVLAYSTSVKQVFIPISLALFTLEYIRKRPSLYPFFLKGLASIAGFIAFGLFTLLFYDNFFLSSDTCVRIFQKKISFAALPDLNNYAKNFWRIGGATTFYSLFLLLCVFVKMLKIWPDKDAFLRFFKEPQETIPVELFLWWVALACTTFYIVGEAYGSFQFMSMFRFQTTNIPLFLLAAYQLKNLEWWKIGIFLFPLLWISVFWQRAYTYQYWVWKWLA